MPVRGRSETPPIGIILEIYPSYISASNSLGWYFKIDRTNLSAEIDGGFNDRFDAQCVIVKRNIETRI